MSAERIVGWVSLITNIALLAGIALVAYEINQNSELVRVQLVNEGNILANEIYANSMGENPEEVIARAGECPEQMSYADFIVMDAFLYTSINILYRDYQLAQEGIFTEARWKGGVDALAHWFLGNEFGRAWWDEEGRNFFEEGFTSYMDATLESEGRDPLQYWSAIRARLTTDSNLRSICNLDK